MANTKITSRVIADNAVTTAAIADDAITSAKLDTNIAVAGTLTVTGDITGTLATAAQPNITSIGTLTALTGGTGDLNWDSGTLFVDSSANAVGIGTSSPDGKLDIQTSSNESGILLDAIGAGNDVELTFNRWTGTASDYHQWRVGAEVDDLTFGYVQGAKGSTPSEKMRIDSSGNVGIGTTSPVAPLTINDKATISFNSSDFALGHQLYYDSVSDRWERLTGNAGSALYQTAGNVLFYRTTAGGATGDAVTPSESMRIDSSGNVGIGTTSPDHPLTVDGTSRHTDWMYGNANGKLYINDDIALNAGKKLYLDGGSNTYLHQASADVMAFITDGSERMRIDSSGHLLVGKTAAAVATQGTEIRSNGEFFSTIGNAVTTLHVYSTAGAYRFYVTGAGQIHATSTSISSLSDERLKENIVDLETGLSEVMALQPRRFDWKNGDKTNVAGFIAQEVETVLPDLIDGFKDESIEDAKGVRMGDMLPTLVKAIQEQQTIIDDLKSRIETLEG